MVLDNETVVRRFGDTLLKITYARTNSLADAEDIVQEVFLRYINHADEMQSEEHIRRWLITAAVKRTQSFFSSAWHRKTTKMPESIAAPAELDHGWLWTVVMGLPEGLRIPLHLHYHEDLPIKEIALIMEKTESAVKSLLHRGRQQLKILIEEAGINV